MRAWGYYHIAWARDAINSNTYRTTKANGIFFSIPENGRLPVLHCRPPVHA